MKKIFWTIVVLFILIFLFRSYVRLFNNPLGNKIGTRFGCPQVSMIDSGDTQITQQLDTIKTQLDMVTKKLESEPKSISQDSSLQTAAPTKLALYYFNQIEDQTLPPEQQVNVNSLLPVYRMFPPSNNLLVDTINELLKGTLTAVEVKEGFITEFPNKKFLLLNANLANDGILTLEFTEVPGFTEGGSARMLILSNSIIKTAKQFPGVKKVVFVPDTLFQP